MCYINYTLNAALFFWKTPFVLQNFPDQNLPSITTLLNMDISQSVTNIFLK